MSAAWWWAGRSAPGSSAIGRDVGALAGIDPLGVPVGSDAGDLFDAADAVLEFTQPDGDIASR